MPEGTIEHAPFTVGAHPSHGEILVLPVHLLVDQVHGTGVQAHQHPQAVAREIAELVDLVVDGERRGKMSRGGEAAVFDIDADLLVPRVTVAVGAVSSPYAGHW